MRPLMLAVLFLTLSAAAAERKGFVWASKPSAPPYAVNDAYVYNSAGAPVTIAREAEGMYRVTFRQLARGATGLGNVQVTAYGPRPHTCGAVNWGGNDDFVVRVRCFALATAAPTDAFFTVLVSWAPDAPLPVLPQAAATVAPEVKKSISPTGEPVLTYPDRIVTKVSGGTRTKFLDTGVETQAMFSTGAPANIPPQEPDNNEQTWLTWHAGRLLDMLKSLVGNDQASIDNYLRSEPATLSVYERINQRREIVNFLLQ